MVYTASTLLMALDAMDNPQAKEESEVKRDRYGTTVTSKKTPCKYPAADQALVEELAKFLRDSQLAKIGGWRYPGNDIGSTPGDVDLSNTQYALFGLNAAARGLVHGPGERGRAQDPRGRLWRPRVIIDVFVSFAGASVPAKDTKTSRKFGSALHLRMVQL